MMTGHVSSLHALVPITFRRSGQPDLALEFVVDTGFTGFLCLPPSAVALLSLPFRYDMMARLADDSEVMLPVHAATILWNGAERIVRVLATGRRPLIGTALLEASEFLAQFAENGIVTIDEL